MRALLLEAPGELNLAPQVDTGLGAGGEDGVMRGDTRGHDDEVGAGIEHRGRQSVRLLLDVDGHARNVVEGQGLRGSRRESANLPAAGERSAGGSLAGLTPADNCGTAVHRADTHSA